MKKPSFSKLKVNYKTLPTQIHSCSMAFPNTCAIRMSEALVKTDSDFLTALKNSSKNKCSHGYLRGAQDLAAVLGSPKVLGTRTLGWTSQANGQPPSNAIGKKGIVCYMNIPDFSGQGHIDLWDGTKAVGDAYWEAKTIWMWTLT
ncbi:MULTISPECIES: T6SS effector amidase Tae4 family protein [Vibrio]|uniref:T6SS effector amidase Tae4 family protein n=1 Tax=Vibrio TaxID=662 RepID=UPI00035F503F|nr:MULTISPECIES: T6SS effector amidase Tae4 family protein [Vibrio]EKO3858959.1 hypothetical protein [Vibrio harveyi]EKO3869905.1 hypothetical protein [Vibrio harveyi]MDA0135355.1 T6SS effector amidase Tae4 family protein [Vibrio sp. NFR]